MLGWSSRSDRPGRPSCSAPASRARRCTDDKPLYADLAARRHLRWWLAGLSALYAAVAAVLIGNWAFLPVWVVLAVVGPMLGYVDWCTHRLPYLIVAPTFAAAWLATGATSLLLMDWHVLAWAAIGNLVIFAGFWLFGRIGEFFLGESIGYGDVRLSAVLGVALGPQGVQAALWGVLAGFLIGSVAGLVITRGKLRASFAFGPYMILGALAGLLG